MSESGLCGQDSLIQKMPMITELPSPAQSRSDSKPITSLQPSRKKSCQANHLFIYSSIPAVVSLRAYSLEGTMLFHENDKHYSL